jgi:hypothetical protein
MTDIFTSEFIYQLIPESKEFANMVIDIYTTSDHNTSGWYLAREFLNTRALLLMKKKLEDPDSHSFIYSMNQKIVRANNHMAQALESIRNAVNQELDKEEILKIIHEIIG